MPIVYPPDLTARQAKWLAAETLRLIGTPAKRCTKLRVLRFNPLLIIALAIAAPIPGAIHDLCN